MPQSTALKATETATPVVEKAKPRLKAVSAAPKKRKKSLKAADVLAYLQSHPAFFTENADKLSQLSQPKKSGNLLSLHAFQANKAEAQAERLATRQKQMVAMANANAAVAGDIFQATLHALQLPTLGALRTWLQTKLPEALELNATRFYLVGESNTATTWTADDVESHCPHPVTLRSLTAASERQIYGPKGKLITSDALLRLDNPQTGAPMAVLALGSTNRTRFNAGQSTELAAFFAQALSIRLHQLLQVK